WKRHIEGCSLVRFAFGPRASSVAMHDAAHICEPDAGSFKLVRPMEPLKDAEQLARILHVESYPIVLYENHDFSRQLTIDADLNFGYWPGTCKLDGIGHQIHEHLPQHRRITRYLRKLVNCPGYLASLQVKSQIVKDGLHQLI